MIDIQVIESVIDKIERLGVEEETVNKLRKDMKDIHFTYCMDDDVCTQVPFREANGFNIYLVTGRDQCVSFTASLESATGLVVAYVDDD
ncbi:MAG: hypothetical protein TECD_01100 [Hyphomicrobiaceae bacterium hypho_1]